MTVDYLSSLNSNGSGLNISQIVDSLVEAEVQPKRSLISNSQSGTEVKISELAELKSNASRFQKNLSTLSFSESFRVENGSHTAFDLETTGKMHDLAPFTSNIEIERLAQKQTLLFVGFDNSDEQLGEISLSLSFGKVQSDFVNATDDSVFEINETLQSQQISLPSGSLEDLAQSLSLLDGVTSEVVQINDGEFGLAIYSNMGEHNAISLTSNIDRINASTVEEFETAQKVSASDSLVKVNGIEFQRDTNAIDDIFVDKTLSLKSTTDQEVTVSGDFDADAAKIAMTQFVSTLNEFKTYLSAVTQRSTDGSSPGVFATDASIKGMYAQLNNLMRQPLEGFLPNDVYLAQMGVMTNRDGTLSLDEDKFENFFDNNRSSFFTLSEDRFIASSDLIDVFVSDPSTQVSGSFDFSFDSETGQAMLDGRILSKFTDGANTIFRSTEEGFEGLQLTVSTNDIPVSATIHTGISASQKLSNLISEFLSSDGEIAQKEKVFDDYIDKYEIDLLSLDTKEAAIRARYIEQFTAMEQVVTKLKSTGDYITTIMDAWNDEQN